MILAHAKEMPVNPTSIALNLTHASVCLPSGHGLSLTDAAGVELTSVTGRVWLTMEGDQRDIDLQPGVAYTIERDGLTLVNAVDTSLLRVSIPHAHRPEWPVWARRSWEWLVRAAAARARARMARGLYHW
jgi:hypothetical protein